MLFAPCAQVLRGQSCEGQSRGVHDLALRQCVTHEIPHVLIVSGDSVFACHLALGVRTGGVGVECAFSFDDAAAIIRRTSPDLIVVDLATRSFNDNAVIAMSEVARESGARLLVLTKQVSEDTSLCASLLGASGCLRKSDPLASLAARLQFLTRYAARNRKLGVVFDQPARLQA